MIGVKLTPVILVIHSRFGPLCAFPNRRKLTACLCGRKTRRTGNGPAEPKAATPKTEGAVAPPRTLAPEAEGRGRTKPRPHKRKRMRGGISRNLHGVSRTALTSRKGQAEPAKAAGIAPWPETAGKRLGASVLDRDPNGTVRRGFGPGGSLRDYGKAFGLSRDPKR